MINDIKFKIKEFILEERSLRDLDINDETPLISSGIIDSITTLSLIDFIEKSFNIEFEPYEVDQENLNTINRITDFILEKQSH